MAYGKFGPGKPEEKILDLLSEYGTLEIEQLEQFFSFQDDIKIPLRTLVKRGRAVVSEKDGIVKAHKDIKTDKILMICFWVIVDLAEEIQHHYRGTYPMTLTFYSEGKSYEVYYCAEGDERTLTHVISQTETMENEKKVFVLENESQMEKIDVSDAVFCMIDEKGDVAYYE